jgi:hypothetical protein
MKECVDLGAPILLILGLKMESLTEKEEKYYMKLTKLPPKLL